MTIPRPSGYEAPANPPVQTLQRRTSSISDLTLAKLGCREHGMQMGVTCDKERRVVVVFTSAGIRHKSSVRAGGRGATGC